MVVTCDDTHFCGPPPGCDRSSAETLRADVTPFYSSSASLRTFVRHGYGHSINYAPHAGSYYLTVAEWAATTVGG